MERLIGKAFGPYKVLEKIGEGGMAVVYRGVQESLERYVAIKVLRTELSADQEFIARFRQEALAVAQLSHPNILHVYDAGFAHGVYYIVMAYVDGGSLKDLIAQGPVEETFACSLAASLADALDYAHQQGLIHRDVKPSNVLLTRDGRPLLTDFGIAKLLDEGQRLTRTGTSIGTPEYMAPEQAQGQAVDGRTDIYALGVVLYEMLAGWVPFSAQTPIATLYRHVNEPPPPLKQINISVPEWLDAIVQKALAKRPLDRFQRASRMAEALRERQAPSAAEVARPAREPARPEPTQRVSAAPATAPAAERRRTGLRPILAALAGLVVVAGLVGGAFALLGRDGEPDGAASPTVTLAVRETTAVPAGATTAAPLAATSSPTPSATAARSPSPSPTPSPSATQPGTDTPEASATPSSTVTRTPTSAPTYTPAPTSTQPPPTNTQPPPPTNTNPPPPPTNTKPPPPTNTNPPPPTDTKPPPTYTQPPPPTATTEPPPPP
jgi:serine/threonine protein kinase